MKPVLNRRGEYGLPSAVEDELDQLVVSIQTGWNVEHDLEGAHRFVNLPTYADATAAKAGGLAVGKVYRTTTGVLMVVV